MNGTKEVSAADGSSTPVFASEDQYMTTHASGWMQTMSTQLLSYLIEALTRGQSSLLVVIEPLPWGTKRNGGLFLTFAAAQAPSHSRHGSRLFMDTILRSAWLLR